MALSQQNLSKKKRQLLRVPTILARLMRTILSRKLMILKLTLIAMKGKRGLKEEDCGGTHSGDCGRT
jgi:hypothetical protein